MTTIVLAAFINSGQVLLARRADHKQQYPGHWDLVGGHIKTGEPIDVALAREAEEEVALTPTTFQHRGSFNDSKTKTAYQLYVVTDWLNGLPQLLGDEHTELAWVPVNDISSVAPLAHPEIISFLRRP